MSNNQAKSNEKQTILVYPTSRRCTKPVMNKENNAAPKIEAAKAVVNKEAPAIDRAG